MTCTPYYAADGAGTNQGRVDGDSYDGELVDKVGRCRVISV